MENLIFVKIDRILGIIYIVNRRKYNEQFIKKKIPFIQVLNVSENQNIIKKLTFIKYSYQWISII